MAGYSFTIIDPKYPRWDVEPPVKNRQGAFSIYIDGSESSRSTDFFATCSRISKEARIEPRLINHGLFIH